MDVAPSLQLRVVDALLLCDQRGCLERSATAGGWIQGRDVAGARIS